MPFNMNFNLLKNLANYNSNFSKKSLYTNINLPLQLCAISIQPIQQDKDNHHTDSPELGLGLDTETEHSEFKSCYTKTINAHRPTTEMSETTPSGGSEISAKSIPN